MIGIVVVTHGNLATEFRDAVEHIVGAQSQFETVTIGPEDDMEQRRSEIVDKVKNVDDGKGVVVLTDMFGGTPSNIAISVMDEANIDVIAGVNLPMLIKLTSLRESLPLNDVVEQAQTAGRDYIKIASRVLANT